jgi:lipoprotein-anchoring transpeptidase ErfK/SrfK
MHKKTVYTHATIGTLFVLLAVSLYYHYLFYTTPEDTVTQTELETGPFLKEEEAVVIEIDDTEEKILPVEMVLFEYVEVRESCDVHFEGECVRIRSGPGLDFPIVTHIRNDVVLRVGGQVKNDNITWYKIIFDEDLRYPERVLTDWYIASDYVGVLYDEGAKELSRDVSSTSKRIIVDISEQKLYAYEGETLFMDISISTGLEISPTPKGTFTIFRKTPSRYMQGPLPGHTDVYDLPGVPWNLYFTHEGAVIHGAYWHRSFGMPYSHGCVNLPPKVARDLYYWADLGVKVTVRN